MSINNWSEHIAIVELQDGPLLADDLTAIMDQVEQKTEVSALVSFSGVSYLNSSNIAKLLRLRKKIISNQRKLVLCTIDTSIWGLFLVTGLDKVFEFSDNIANGLAMIQMTDE